MSKSNEADFIPEIRRKHQAFYVLHVMANPACNRSATDSMLHDCLEMAGLYSPRTYVRGLLDHLEQIGLLRTRKFDEWVVATLTEKGERVAAGKDRTESVAVFYPD